MNKSKRLQIRRLIEDIKNDTAYLKVKPPLVNHFQIHDKIPNRWFDWERRVDSPIMIIGQDWGPYIHLKKYIDNPSTDHFASSRTESFIIKTLNTINRNLIDTIFFTVSVIYTRTGSLFRGNANYNEAKSFEVSFPFVSRQIDIVKPKIIMTLGGLAFKTLNMHYKLGVKGKTLKDVVEKGKVKTSNTLIIPAYHPAAFVNPEIQLRSWKVLEAEVSKLIKP